MSYIDIKNGASLTAMTFCLWVATEASLLVEYKATSDHEQFRGFSLVSNSRVELLTMQNITMYVK